MSNFRIQIFYPLLVFFHQQDAAIGSENTIANLKPNSLPLYEISDLLYEMGHSL